MTETETPPPSSSPPQPEIRWLSVHDLEPDPLNPQIEDLGTFNDLVEGIKAHGMLEPLLVAPLGENKYRIVAGEHRWKGSKLAGLETLPCVIAENWDADTQRVQMVRMNAIHGKFDPVKFTALWKSLSKTYGEEGLRRMMGFNSHETELRRLIKSTGDQLPDEAKRELQKRAEKIRSVEDLASMVQSLMAKYGETIDYHFVGFELGGKSHLLIRCSNETFAPIQVLADWCRDHEMAMDYVMGRLLQGDPLLEMDLPWRKVQERGESTT